MSAIHSMTAFARSEANLAWGSLAWEVRSVNHRYLETQLRLPDTLRHVETAARERLRERLARGKVDCSLRLHLEEQAGSRLLLDENLVRSLHEACNRVAELGNGLAAANTLDVLRWPGVVAQAAPDMEEVSTEAIALLGRVLAELEEMRPREGQRLAEFLEQRLAQIETIVASLRQAMPEIIAAQRQRLAERVAEMNISIDPGRLEQEIVLLAAKRDIAEWLYRLDAHGGDTLGSLRQGGACGRRLDFLMQEFNREANTLSSKSIATTTTQAAIELKVLIEQMREQVQNIE